MLEGIYTKNLSQQTYEMSLLSPLFLPDRDISINWIAIVKCTNVTFVATLNKSDLIPHILISHAGKYLLKISTLFETVFNLYGNTVTTDTRNLTPNYCKWNERFIIMDTKIKFSHLCTQLNDIWNLVVKIIGYVSSYDFWVLYMNFFMLESSSSSWENFGCVFLYFLNAANLLWATGRS